MRRTIATGLIGLAILLCAARPASAQWKIIKWLEELSGPGKVWVQQISFHVGCRWKDKPGDAEARTFEDRVYTPRFIMPDLFCDQNPIPRQDGKYQGQALWKSVRSFYTVDVTIPWFTGTGTNPLDYPEGEKEEHLTVWGLAPGFAYRLSEFTDVGFTTGVIWLSGSTERTTSKLVTDLYVVIRPLAKVGRWGDSIDVRFGGQWFPQGFTLDDFGATAGSLDGKSEWVTQIGFGIHLYKVFYNLTTK